VEGLTIALVVIATLALDLALMAYSRRNEPDKRKVLLNRLESSRPTAIAALVEGELARITGVGAPRGALLTSPLGHEPCIGYSTVIEERDHLNGTWRRVFTSAHCGPFLVTDESGTAAVDGPVFITLDPADAAWTNLPGGVLITPAHKLLHEVASSRVGDDLAGREIRCQEVLVRPGERVNVFGRARMEVDPAGPASLRDPPMLNHITGSEDAPVVVAHDRIPLG
jgi:hypothetical protein